MASLLGRPYYETRANYNGILKAQKNKINQLESKVAESKMIYNAALNNLEQISEEIHRKREIRKQKFNDNNCQENLAHSENEKSANKLNSNASPTTEKHDDERKCPQFNHDFERILTLPPRQVLNNGPFSIRSTDSLNHEDGNKKANHLSQDDTDIEQWTEIRLSHSESTSSSYSNQSLHDDETAVALLGSNSSSSSDGSRRKVTCTTIFQEEDQAHKKQSLSQWLNRTNSLKNSGRRQSLDLLIDAGDKVKDVFSMGFQKVGKTLERRNSESEMNVEQITSNKSDKGTGPYYTTSNPKPASTTSSNSATEFFLFSRSVRAIETRIKSSFFDSLLERSTK